MKYTFRTLSPLHYNEKQTLKYKLTCVYGFMSVFGQLIVVFHHIKLYDYFSLNSVSYKTENAGRL